MSKIRAGINTEEAIVQTLSELALPCFLTSLTTSIGFGAFLTSASPSVSHYGVTVGIGVLLAFVTTVTVLPLVLSIAPVPAAKAAQGVTPAWLDGALTWLGGVVTRRTATLVMVAVMLLGAGAWFGSSQHLRNRYVGNLPDGDAKSKLLALEDKLYGLLRMNIFLEGPPDSMKRPEVLRAIEFLDRSAERMPGVTFSGSLADLVSEMNLAFNDNQPGERRIPDSKGLVSQYLAPIDPLDRADFVTESYANSQISIFLKERGSEIGRGQIRDLEALIERSGLAKLGIKAELTGQGVVGFRELDRVVIELLYGFVTAFLVVIAFEWLLFRSLRIALLTIIPNLIPVAICFVVTRGFDIPLRMDNILVLCVSIGGLFNTTIHFVARVRQLVAAGEHDPDRVVVEAMRAIGPPSLYTAAILSIGFAVFMLSDFAGLRAMGLLSMVTLMSGFFSDMLFTPPLIRLGMDWQGAFREKKQSLPEPGALSPTT
jgi:predicted RND superfamily exporter protein